VNVAQIESLARAAVRRECLRALAAHLLPGKCVVLDDAPPAWTGGRCTCAADGVFHIQVSARLAPDTFARVILHELGHIAGGHVGPPTALSLNPPPILRAAWAIEAEKQEREAERWAAAAQGALTAMEKGLLRAMAQEREA